MPNPDELELLSKASTMREWKPNPRRDQSGKRNKNGPINLRRLQLSLTVN